VKSHFLPFLREGLRPSVAGAARPRVELTVQLSAPGQPSRDLTQRYELVGPGDVLGLDPAQILRVSPPPGTSNAEVELFPSIELDDPDLPWAFSPLPAVGTRCAPWLCLVVVKAQPGVTVEPGSAGQSGWILTLTPNAARDELPPLAESWAWAHAQVSCETPAQIPATLSGQPDRCLARLLSPRRLEAQTRYHACVVPTFRAGRAAGLGEPEDLSTAPAWSATDLPAQLPAYHAWTFTTGDAGDFESLARRLRPAPLDATAPATPLHLSVGGVVDFEPPFRVPGRVPERERAPQAVVDAIRSGVQPSASAPPVLGPSYLGGSWTPAPAFAPLSAWAPELNLLPMRRAAAGLGAEVVRREQEALVAAAEVQLTEQRARQRAGRQKRAAAALQRRLEQRLMQAPATERARVLAPARATGEPRADLGLYTFAGRRLTRKLGGQQARVLSTRVVREAAARERLARELPLLEVATLDLELHYAPARALDRVPLDVRLEPVDPAAIGEGAFAPRFGRPMIEPFAQRFPELVLPALGELPGEAATLVEPDAAFIEAYLVGANEELNRELLWRGLPSDPRATAFRRFFPRTDGADDISELGAWSADSALGSHLRTPAALVLVLRGELVRRYPSLVLGAIPARWSGPGARGPDTTQSAAPPMFRGRVGDDVVYAGFATPTVADALGGAESSGPAGWFFVLAENPGDARFGLDPSASGPPTRDTLAWTHLSSSRAYAEVSAFPAVPGFSPGAASSATLASLLRQRPFRAFLHASTLIRPRS
jgi:hypothetical protein